MRKELVEAREKLEFTQETIAQKLRISRSFYGLIETGARNISYGLALNIYWGR